VICIVCLSLYGTDVEAVTVVSGNACCRSHVNIVGLSKAASRRIRSYDEQAKAVEMHEAMQRALSRETEHH
jgi:hypothetical protein